MKVKNDELMKLRGTNCLWLNLRSLRLGGRRHVMSVQQGALGIGVFCTG